MAKELYIRKYNNTYILQNEYTQYTDIHAINIM